ncbi:glycine-rich domain-containing protein, partial [Algoriphagus zhangzhouensis]
GNTITISGTPSVSGTFNYSIPVEGCLSSGVNATGTIVVNPVATISNMTGGACTDGSFSFVPTNGIDGSIPAGTTYSWSVPTVTGGMTGGVSGSGASDISGTLSNPTNSPQTATYLVTPTSGTCDGPQFTITITVDPITAITTQPDTMGEVECFGDGFSEISVSAIGGDLTYQWYSTSTPINSGGTAVSGATSANFTPPSTTLGSNYYYVVVTGNCGIESSDVSGEYIVTPPVTTVTNHPSTSDQTVCNGGTFSPLSVTAIGEGTVSYQWYSNTSNSNSGGTLITGATSDTYTPPTSTNGTTYYYVVANSDCGTVPTNVSGAFTVTPLTEITLEELDAQAICDGDTFDPISITATGTGTITYQWYSNATNSNSGGTLITGATADTYNPPATAAGTTTFYYVTVSSDCGPNVTSSVSGAFTVNPLPVPTFVTEPTSDICVGTSVTYTTQSGSGEHDYLWTIPGVSGTDYTITSGGIGSSDPTVTVTWLTDGSKDVSVSYTNANNCIATTTADNSLIVNPLPVPTFEVEPTAPVCVGSSVTYTTQSGSGESNYLWTIPGTSGVDYTITSGGNGTSDPTVTLTWLTDGSKDVSVSYTNANNCIATTTANNTLFVNPLPVPTFTTSPGANVCEQSDVTYTTQSGKSDYIWNIPGTEGTDYTITSGGTSSDETVILQWLTTGSQTVEVSYTEPSTGCIATSAASSTTDVEPFATVGATSVAFPSVCSNNPTLTPFTQPTTGVTGIGTPTGLPAGVTATFNSSTGNIEFSGNVSGAATGLYTYSIPLTGNCINGLEATGTIDVTPDYEITAISSVSATSIGGSATVTFYGDPAEMLNGTYELYYQIKQGGGSFSSPIAVTATVNNGKGTFSTTAINSNVDTYTVQLLSIKKSTDVCNIILTSLPTTYFGVCSAVFTSGTNTFYVPANVYSITIEVYGGGGGGDNGGAGGGAYSIRTNVPVTPGEPLAVITGAGGARNGNNNGGVSYVTRDSNIADQLANSLVYANGGNSGSNSNANKGVGGTFDTRYSGYNGSTVTGNPGGAGGGPLGGAGGANGGDGYSPGGGGGKASGQGGDGGSGLVVISYSCPDADNTDCVTVIDDGSKSGYTVLEYTCDDTWTAPEGLSEFTVYVGSGGGGGGSGEGSGGGGSGALIVQTFTTTNPYGLPAGTDFGIIVGAGGPGAGVGERPGTNGEASEFTGEIDGNSIDILVAGGGGGGSQLVNAGGHGSSGGGGGATPAPNKSFGAGGNAIPLTYTGTPDAVYNGNPGGNGDYNDPQNAIAGGGGGGLVPWKLPPANDGQNGKAAGAGQGEGGRGGDAINLALGDSLRYFGAGGGGIGEYFNGTEKIGEGGSSLLDGTKLGGDGNLDILNTSGIGYSGVNKTGSGGGAGYNGGGKGGDGVIYIVFTNFSILEVEYLYFEASYLESDRSGKLKWATSQEWENSHFEIERSINNVKNWEKIGEVEGAGYSSEAIEYEFIDKNLPVNGGMIYYRLKQVDFEGDFTYSVTRSIQANPKNGSGYWVAYPNPSGRTEYVNLSLLNPSVYQDEPIIVRISDFKGVSESYTVHSPEDVSNTVNYHLRNSDHGLFIIQLLWGKHEQQIKIIRK